MADLRRLCRDQATGPDQLWSWPIEGLAQALAWPAHCLRDVERYRFAHGAAPKLDVPSCALLPGDPGWPRCLDDVYSPPSGYFAARNRWLVAFAQALVVVECPQRSGALISARWASRMQSHVWVVPRDARHWSFRGSNALLRDGATALMHPEDLLASICQGPLRSEESCGKHQRLMEAIGSGATFDQLVLRLQCSLAELAPQLQCQRELLCESGLHWRKPRP